MKPKLTDLRTAMDNSVFKKEQFTEIHKQQVLNRIAKQERKLSWVPRSLSFAFSLILFLSVTYLLASELNNGFQDSPMQQGSERVEQTPSSQNEPVEPSVPAILEKEEETTDPAPQQDEVSETEEKAPEELFVLSPEELEAYGNFKEDYDTAYLEGLEPISVAKLYIFAGYTRDPEVQYELYTDREESIMWDKTYHLTEAQEHQATPESIATAFHNLDKGVFIQTGDYQGYIEFSPTENPEEVMGFQMIQNEDGIWQVSFMPIQ